MEAEASSYDGAQGVQDAARLEQTRNRECEEEHGLLQVGLKAWARCRRPRGAVLRASLRLAERLAPGHSFQDDSTFPLVVLSHLQL